MYYMVFALGLGMSLFGKRKETNTKVYALILMLLSFFRYGVGVDYFAYNFLYNRINPSILTELTAGLDRQELLFRLIASFMKKLHLPYQLFLVVFAFVTILYVYKLCSRYSKNSMLSLFLFYSFFYFVWVFSGVRQGLVLAVGLYYLLVFLEEDKTRYLLLVSFLLSFIHISAFILIPLYFVVRRDFTRKEFLLLLLVAIVVGLLPVNKIVSKVPILRTYYIGERHSVFRFLFSFKSLVRLFFLLLSIGLYPYVQEKEKYAYLVKVNIIGLTLYFALQFNEGFAARISLYGFYLSFIVLVNFYYLLGKEKVKRLYLILLMLFSVAYFNRELNSMVRFEPVEEKFYIPYTTIFNQENFIFTNKYYDLTR